MPRRESDVAKTAAGTAIGCLVAAVALPVFLVAGFLALAMLDGCVYGPRPDPDTLYDPAKRSPAKHRP